MVDIRIAGRIDSGVEHSGAKMSWALLATSEKRPRTRAPRPALLFLQSILNNLSENFQDT